MSERIELVVGEAGSKMQMEFDRDNGLAQQYLAEANVKGLYQLYHHRCRQLSEFGATLSTMAEMYAGKGGARDFATSTPDAVTAMERVALAAIDLAKTLISDKD
jgi:hypothetical protein